MLKKVLLVVLAVVLLILPLVVRRIYYYDGKYEPAEVARPDLDAIQVSTPEMSPFEDRIAGPTPGIVLVDMAHSNRFDMAELGVLQARLAARGQRLEAVEEAEDLAQQLRYANALVVISPGENWTPEEIRLAGRFVDKGGRLLLVADPTRYALDWDLLILDYDAPHLNDLAARFGLLFQPGYLYNTVDNEGNFRNIRLTEFADHELTAGLDQVVFYAAGSIASEELALVSASGDTGSSISERVQDLPVAVLAADGLVLALSDLTFMTEGHSGAYDNDQFVAHIADFLSNSQRLYDLSDFPLFLEDEADLIFVGAPLLDSDLLQGGSELQALFDRLGKELSVRQKQDEASDTLLLGLYEGAESVEPYLAAAGVTVLITPTEPLQPEELEPTALPVPTPTPSSPLTTTLEVTSAVEITVTPEVTPAQAVSVTAEISPTAQSRVRIESVGEMVLTGTTLLLLQTDGERQVVVALAHTEKGLENAIERLTTGDLEDCVLQGAEPPTLTLLALCPTGEVEAGDGSGGWQKTEAEPGEEEAAPEKPSEKPPAPEPDSTSPITDTETITETETITDTVEPEEPVGEPEGSIMVISLDRGEGRYDSRTSAEEYAAILEERYDVTIWSTSVDGALDGEELLEYDLVIWSFGDFDTETALEDEEADAVITLMFSGIPFIMSGAYIGDSANSAIQRDVQISDATHPVAEGFGEEEIIEFVLPPSGEEYEIGVIDELDAEQGSVVLVRGPNSEEEGAPSVLVQEDEFTQVRIGLIGFPLYLLPEEAQSRLVLNMVGWMLSP